jgi:hypothetical protein
MHSELGILSAGSGMVLVGVLLLVGLVLGVREEGLAGVRQVPGLLVTGYVSAHHPSAG